MRKIKFRAWDSKNDVMRDWDYIRTSWTLGILSGDSNTEVMQFTGLKDKNGKEIYEGDILFVSNWEYAKNHYKPRGRKSDYEGVFVVRIETGHWGIDTTWEHIRGYECSTHIMGETGENNSPNVEVIGNIYENPELLTTNPT